MNSVSSRALINPLDTACQVSNCRQAKLVSCWWMQCRIWQLRSQILSSDVGGEQNRSIREVNIGLRFVTWPETHIQMKAGVSSMFAGCVNTPGVSKSFYFMGSKDPKLILSGADQQNHAYFIVCVLLSCMSWVVFFFNVYGQASYKLLNFHFYVACTFLCISLWHVLWWNQRKISTLWAIKFLYLCKYNNL